MISIVIPLYNKEQSIERTLDSVLAQTYTDYECIIVNDGSTDNSAEVVKDYLDSQTGNNKSQIRLVCQPNAGVSAARNRGIAEAKGEYIAFLDADDLWDKEYLAEQVRMIADFPECAMWSINYGETINGQIIRRVPTGLPDGFRGIVHNYFELPQRVSDLVCSSSVVLRREVFDLVCYFDERIRYAEDTDVWWRVMARYPMAFYDRYMVFYRFDGENRAMKLKRRLVNFLPCYVGKFATFKGNEIFYRYVQRWCAIWLARYYFNSPDDRQIALKASADLDYSVISPKYWFFFHFPYHMAKGIYKSIEFYKAHKS